MSTFISPPHQRRVAHTLNLIATNEVDKAASQGPSRKLCRSAMGKCFSIWNKAHGSTRVAEMVQDIANMHITVPCVTRWSSEYRAIAKLVGLTDDQLGEEYRVHPQELAFLKEYAAVLQPLTFSIDLLQGEKKCHLGFLIPTILSLKSKLSEKLSQVKYTTHIVATVIKAIDCRFGVMLSSHEAKMAIATLPKFRLCWLNPEENGEHWSKKQQVCTMQTLLSLKRLYTQIPMSQMTTFSFLRMPQDQGGLMEQQRKRSENA